MIEDEGTPAEPEAGDELDADESAVALNAPVEAHDGEPDDEAAKADESEKAAKREGYKERARTRRLLERAEQLQSENDQLRASRSQPVDEPPDRDSFNDYEDFLTAQARYAAKQEFTSLRSEEDARQAEWSRNREQQNLEDKWAESVEESREKFADFDDIALSDDNEISQDMGLAIKASKVPGEIAYYLGKNPVEATKIAKGNLLSQIMAIGALEERLTGRPTRPPPPKPVSRGRTSQNSASTTLSDDMPMAQWLKVREAQLGRS